ncbi:MAG: hypothetical protein IJ176_08975 [Prevotella sp.]|nr:hypothetical protein [Prevotella sp.]
MANGTGLLDQHIEIKNSEAKVKNGNMEGGISVTPSFKFGAGIGTKKVSVCIYGSNTIEASGTSFGINSLSHVDISDKPGLTIKDKLEIGLQVGLTLNVYELVKGIQEDALDLGFLGVKGYKYIVKKLKDKGLVKDDFPADAEMIQEFLKSCQETIAKQDADVSKKLESIPLDLPIPKIPIYKDDLKSTSLPWMPQMKNFSYKRKSTTSEGATYYVTWTYSDKGFFPTLGWGPFYPCVYVDGGKDDKATGTYHVTKGGYDDAGPIGKDTNIKNYGTGIDIPNLQPGKSYTIYPALATGYGKDAFFFDVAQVLTPSYPMVKIVSTDQESCYQTATMEQSGYYGYILEAKVAVMGAAKIHEWQVEFHLSKQDGSDLEYNKRVRGNDVKETKGHPLRIDLTYYKPEFETTMFGMYHVIESQPGEELHTTPMEIKGYPLIGAWSEWNFSRRRTNQLSAPLAPVPSENIDKIDEMLEDPDFDKDVPIVFIDGELVTPVAITKNGIRKPIPPLR